MGLIRKALFASTGGIVAPNSKKQRVAKQTLAAIQGCSDQEVELTGTRRQALGWATDGFRRPAAISPMYTSREIADAVELIHGPPLACGHLACYRLPDGGCDMCWRESRPDSN